MSCFLFFSHLNSVSYALSYTISSSQIAHTTTIEALTTIEAFTADRSESFVLFQIQRPLSICSGVSIYTNGVQNESFSYSAISNSSTFRSNSDLFI